MIPTESWQSKVAKKQAEVKAAIPHEWLLPSTITPTSNVLNIPRQSGILSNHELDITESYNAVQLLEKLAAGIWTSAEVTEAFCKRAAIAQQLDSFNVKGVQSTIGFVSFLDHEISKTNSVLVDVLLELGAVLYVKTNIPQTLMTADSDNNIFGRTLNPNNTTLTAGGSSGGEGALVAFRGSILGVGTDIAGSIRIPSLCCGTYGFKPTSGRIPFGGQASPTLPGIPGIVPCAGPLANSMDDINLFVSSVLNAKPWLGDSNAHAVPWRQTTEFSKKTSLTIGILAEDPSFPLHPPVRRTINNAAEKLAAAGHKIVYLKYAEATSTSLGSRIAMESFTIDPSATSIQHIIASGEPKIPSVTMTLALQPPPKKYGLLELAQLNVEKFTYREAWRERFQAEELDVVVAPGAQHTAVPHDTYGEPPFTVMWNCLDYPACIIPYGRASKELDPDPVIFSPGPNYDPKLVDGAPCAIQIVAPRFQDEECLYAAKIIDQVLKSTDV
ncbi:hypothetical protein G7Y89_g4647 [Cudoniella acicularis]|uniref:amidase n=1 Tax=Cudoniella acicularis TaxID=354080 RepID=A0A8H4RS25_9HELO|nr:hypothetical protein G7Y89_g4647 [Cudoniella acicularis]